MVLAGAAHAAEIAAGSCPFVREVKSQAFCSFKQEANTLMAMEFWVDFQVPYKKLLGD